MKRKLITSALPYVNNVPHLGNLIQVLSADCFARFCRLRGYETLYVCGTDEYGTATETRAAEEGVSPRELCDRYWKIHSGIYAWFNIAFDKFGRTSTPIQTEVTQDIFRKLDAAGFITEKTVEQLYCDKCGRFLADRYVRGTCPSCGYDRARGDQCENCGKLLDPTDLKNPRCSSCGQAPRLRSTKHLYIDLPKIRPRLEAWIDAASVKGEWANNAVAMTKSWIRDGLHERAITRDLKWGIPVPKAGYEDKVFYVWFDAPIGYVSITGNLGAERGGAWQEFVAHWWHEPENVELFQFIGKDNIPFHTVIFPSSQLGSEGAAGTGDRWTMLHHMSSTEYLNYEAGKFSKSEGVGVFGTDVMETGIPADVWRFYIFYNRPEKADALFTWKDFAEKVNGELIGNLGNLVNRTLTFVTRYYGGEVPVEEQEPAPRSPLSDFWHTLRNYETRITAKLEWAELRDAFHLIFELTDAANKAFQAGEPWKTRTSDPPAAAALLHSLCCLVRDLAVLLQPYTPEAAERIAGFFGKTLNPAVEGHLGWSILGKASGIERVVKTEVLFTRLEDERIAELREKYAGKQAERTGNGEAAHNNAAHNAAHSNAAAGDSTADTHPGTPLPTFAALDLRVACITAIEKHPKADKLYIETLDIGGEERTIVSGLVPYYRPEELLGKHIIVAYNLKSAKLRGVESRGMLLAASTRSADGSKETVEVLDAGSAPAGTRVTLAGEEPAPAPAEIDADTFFAVPIIVKSGLVQSNGRPLTAAGRPLLTRIVTEGDVG